MTQPTTPENTPNPASAAPPTKRRKWPWIIGGLAAVAIGGSVVAQTFHPSFGPMRGGFMGRGGMDPASIAEFADRGVRHLGIEIDATPEQQDKLRAITRALVLDVAPMHNLHIDAMQRGRALLTQQNFDKAGLEKFRAEQIGRMDEASKRVTQAIGEAAEILTPEQRRKLGDLTERRGRGFGPMRHGAMGGDSRHAEDMQPKRGQFGPVPGDGGRDPQHGRGHGPRGTEDGQGQRGGRG